MISAWLLPDTLVVRLISADQPPWLRVPGTAGASETGGPQEHLVPSQRRVWGGYCWLVLGLGRVRAG